MADRIEEIKGRVKEAAGKVTGNERLEAEGEAQASRRKKHHGTEARVRTGARFGRLSVGVCGRRRTGE